MGLELLPFYCFFYILVARMGMLKLIQAQELFYKNFSYLDTLGVYL